MDRIVSYLSDRLLKNSSENWNTCHIAGNATWLTINSSGVINKLHAEHLSSRQDFNIATAVEIPDELVDGSFLADYRSKVRDSRIWESWNDRCLTLQRRISPCHFGLYVCLWPNNNEHQLMRSSPLVD
ncbi:hypothetical protein LOAG_02256 [Loa loa]|uniref:Uncharacterized protein n=1 Tax=Loa loa TaxID=7209 RepID=A0A1S0U7C1_LOALO|nr:hypothetical protein LOAG_02256 [Loa loa]EFO26230.1 hypothetical protein LOAG_02256 [Loa loa]